VTSFRIRDENGDTQAGLLPHFSWGFQTNYHSAIASQPAVTRDLSWGLGGQG